ncbi:hypothetical protein [Acinetobacter variabilis]|uniref:Uncharacterized protein n=1 Tax=Acinetobacter variabilis TaxID=70346 RepID=N8WVP0_9GAMM|nr:hypothetical protein [Acinetobacter variabilis]ENU99357.1 hypothetical protein F969_01676 [Acinetobacter variabilis]
MSLEMLVIEPKGIFIKFKDDFKANDFNLTLEIPNDVDLLYLAPTQYDIDTLGIWVSGSTELNENLTVKVKTLILWDHIKIISVVEDDTPHQEIRKNQIGFVHS